MRTISFISNIAWFFLSIHPVCWKEQMLWNGALLSSSSSIAARWFSWCPVVKNWYIFSFPFRFNGINILYWRSLEDFLTAPHHNIDSILMVPLHFSIYIACFDMHSVPCDQSDIQVISYELLSLQYCNKNMIMKVLLPTHMTAKERLPKQIMMSERRFRNQKLTCNAGILHRSHLPAHLYSLEDTINFTRLYNMLQTS